jgi:D-3-phosphoglycerate dehydrogenase
VNALQLAADRGLKVAEIHETRASTYTDSIRLELESSEGTASVEGAVVLGHPRLLSVNGVACEATLDGNLAFLVNEDVPGTIGFIGGVLGKAQVNIANFSLGRADEAKPGEPMMAVSVVETDSPVPEAVLQELLGNKAIKVARVIQIA